MKINFNKINHAIKQNNTLLKPIEKDMDAQLQFNQSKAQLKAQLKIQSFAHILHSFKTYYMELSFFIFLFMVLAYAMILG